MSRMSKGLRDLEDIEAVFGALAHATRRHILVVLNARGGRVPAGDIAARFSCSWPTTSRHLKVLLEAGLVTVERAGREWIYVLRKDRLDAVAGGWLNFFSSEEKQNVENPDRVRRLPAARGQGRGAA
jgi:DNA-binding transcriptional ArsR family regulator